MNEHDRVPSLRQARADRIAELESLAESRELTEPEARELAATKLALLPGLAGALADLADRVALVETERVDFAALDEAIESLHSTESKIIAGLLGRITKMESALTIMQNVVALELRHKEVTA